MNYIAVIQGTEPPVQAICANLSNAESWADIMLKANPENIVLIYEYRPILIQTIRSKPVIPEKTVKIKPRKKAR